MDYFLEQVVTRRNRGLSALLYPLALVLMGLTGAYALFLFMPLLNELFANGFSLPLAVQLVFLLLMAACAVLIFLFKDRLRTEYEYTITNGSLDFARVYNNRRRKNLGTMTVGNVEACGRVASGSFRRYASMPGVRKLNWFLNRDADLFYLFFSKNGVRTLMVIEPNPAMEELIIRAAGPGKLQRN